MTRITEAQARQIMKRNPAVRTVHPVSSRAPKIPQPSEGEELLNFQINAMKLPQAERQYRFARPRRWAADFAWPTFKILLDCHGGVFTQGRHTRGTGFTDDCERRSIAAILGFSFIEATTEQVYAGDAVAWVEKALRARGWAP